MKGAYHESKKLLQMNRKKNSPPGRPKLTMSCGAWTNCPAVENKKF
jgi:hypothetical protein